MPGSANPPAGWFLLTSASCNNLKPPDFNPLREIPAPPQLFLDIPLICAILTVVDNSATIKPSALKHHRPNFLSGIRFFDIHIFPCQPDHENRTFLELISYEMQIPQPLCFVIHTNCLGVYTPPYTPPPLIRNGGEIAKIPRHTGMRNRRQVPGTAQPAPSAMEIDQG